MQWWCAAQGTPWSWEWQAYPGVWIFCLSLIAGWAKLRRDHGTEADGGARTAAWLGGVAALWIALDWPVGALGAGYLASVHMVQYLLIALIAPPLLLIGLPRGVYDRLVEGIGGSVVRVVTHPIVSMCTFVAIMGYTHWPPVVDGLMATQLGSFTLDLLWLASGLLFWWPIAAPKPEREWLTDGTRIGYLIAATLVNTGVFAYLTFADLPLYATYELAPPVGGLSTRDDQLIAGMLMKVGGAPIIWTAITILFFRAYAAADSLGREKEETLSPPAPGPGEQPDQVPVDPGTGRPVRNLVIALLMAVPLVAGCADAGTGDPGEREGAEVTAGAEAGTSPVVVRDARMGRPALPDRAAAYFTLENSGPSPVRLVGAEPAGRRLEGASVSLHETSTTGGSMRMAPLDTLHLAPGETVELRPGGIHLMVTGSTVRPEVGDTVDIELRFLDGNGAVLRVPVGIPVVPLAEVGG